MLFIVLFQVVFAAASLAQISIPTPPSLAQCQAWTITWTGGTGRSSPPLVSTDISPVLHIHLPRILSYVYRLPDVR
jgi:hypothetical protein